MAKRKTTSRIPISPDTDDERIFSTDEVLARIPYTRITIWRKVREGTFPKPIRLGPSRNGWRQSAILKWIKDREDHPVAQRQYFGRGAKTLEAGQ